MKRGTLAGLLLFSAIFAPLALADEDICRTGGWMPNAKTVDEYKRPCKGIPSHEPCEKTREYLFNGNQKYQELSENECQKTRAATAKIDELNQSSSYAQVVSEADSGIEGVNTLLEANRRLLSGIPDAVQQNLSALDVLAKEKPGMAAPVKQLRTYFADAKRDSAKFNNTISVSGLSGGADGIAQVDALSQSREFAVSLLRDKKANEDARANLQQMKAKAQAAATNTRTGGSDNSGDSGSGFNPMSLLPLAAPLASMLMQKNASQDSGLSAPSSPAAEAPASIPGTALTGQGSTSGAPLGSSSTPGTQGPDTGVGKPLEPGNPYEGSPLGDISSGSGIAKETGASGGSLASYGTSSGASTNSGDSFGSSPEKRKPASAPTAATAEDGGLAAMGGGGMPAYSASSSTDTAEDAGGMKDMLQDMETTLDNSPSGLFAEAEQLDDKQDIGAEDGESLFPRVRACYVRNLKKGFVLNGLGEKLPESENH